MVNKVQEVTGCMLDAMPLYKLMLTDQYTHHHIPHAGNMS